MLRPNNLEYSASSRLLGYSSLALSLPLSPAAIRYSFPTGSAYLLLAQLLPVAASFDVSSLGTSSPYSAVALVRPTCPFGLSLKNRVLAVHSNLFHQARHKRNISLRAL